LNLRYNTDFYESEAFDQHLLASNPTTNTTPQASTKMLACGVRFVALAGLSDRCSNSFRKNAT